MGLCCSLILYKMYKSKNIEFEYAVTNGDLDIDKIISQRKIREIFRLQVISTYVIIFTRPN